MYRDLIQILLIYHALSANTKILDASAESVEHPAEITCDDTTYTESEGEIVTPDFTATVNHRLGTFEFELNGTQYQYDGGTMHGKALATWKYSGPYVGTGFDLGLIGGLKIYFDAGVVFTRKTAELNLQIPTTDLNYYNGSTWVPANTAQLETDTNAVIDDAQRELDKMKYFPVIKIGLMYRF